MWRLLKGERDPGTAGLLGRELKAGRVTGGAGSKKEGVESRHILKTKLKQNTMSD